jgi:TonB family protein
LEQQVREYRVPSSVRDGELHLLLADLYQDDIERYRRREAAWISAVVHAVIVLLLMFSPKWMGRTQVKFVPIQQREDTTFLELPPDQLKVKPPKTSIISDKDRIAQSRTPAPTKEALHKLIDPRNPGRPNNTPQPAPAQQAAQATPEQQPAPQQGPAQSPAQQQPTQTAKLEAPIPPRPKVPFTMSSPGSSVSRAIESVANSHGTQSVPFGGGGEYGSGFRPKVDTHGNLEILSDTLGVDFGPYMRRLKLTVQDHWYQIMPQSAMPPEMKKGVVVLEFAILKDGRVAGLKVVRGSGDIALDRAAYGGITYSNPLPALPQNFGGEYLLLRASFYYNPDKNDLE